MQTLDHKQFAEKFGHAGDAIIINVLDPEMYHNEHIPGSVNVPLQSLDFLERVNEIAEKGDPVVVYCGSLDCPASEQAARQLEEDGFTKIYDFAGGMDEWKKAGHETETNIPAGPPSAADDEDEEEDSATGGCCGGGCH